MREGIRCSEDPALSALIERVLEHNQGLDVYWDLQVFISGREPKQNPTETIAITGITSETVTDRTLATATATKGVEAESLGEINAVISWVL